jgi:betaine-aldehyde dehydrogenase
MSKELPESNYRGLFGAELSKGERRKREIIEATIDSIARDGLHRTTFDSIGRRLGVHRAQVAYHFPDLDALILTTLQFVSSISQGMAGERVAAAATPELKLEAYIRAPFEWLTQYPRHASTRVALYQLAVTDKAYRAFHTETRVAGAKRAEQFFADFPGISPARARDLARGVQLLITGAFVHWVSTAETESLEEVADYLVRMAFEWVGIKPAAAPRAARGKRPAPRPRT